MSLCTNCAFLSEIVVCWALVGGIFHNEACESSMTSCGRDLGSCDIEADHVLFYGFSIETK